MPSILSTCMTYLCIVLICDIKIHNTIRQQVKVKCEYVRVCVWGGRAHTCTEGLEDES